MIQVLLLILKIIGITLLIILGLILLVLALVLFVPVFYRVRVIHNPEKTEVRARVSFLFPLLLVTFQYLKKVSYKIRVFGFALLDSEKPKKEKKVKQKKKKRRQDEKTVAEPVIEPKPEPESLSEPEPVSEPAPESAPESTPEFVSEFESGQQEVTKPAHKPESEPEKKGFFEKIRLKIKKIRETISNIICKIKKLLHQKDEVQRILGEPSTKKALAFVWNELKHLLKHVLPRKIKGYVNYGADDPATTGQVLGILGVVYAKTGQLVEIRPNFEEKQLECDVELKGHVQIFTLLVIAVKVFLNQELRQLISEFKKVKEIE